MIDEIKISFKQKLIDEIIATAEPSAMQRAPQPGGVTRVREIRDAFFLKSFRAQ